MSSTWNYRVMAHQCEGYVYFHVHEVYYDKGEPKSYSLTGRGAGGDSIGDIVWTLDKMKEAATRPILWYGYRFPEEYNPT